MRLLTRLLAPKTIAHAHCDLPCGVYDPAQARIEAESVKAIAEKYAANEDPVFRARALIIKEQRSELVKHHLWVLWTDYFKPPHFEKYPQLHSCSTRPPSWRRGRHQGIARRRDGGRAAGQDRRDRQDLLGDQAGLSPGADPVVPERSNAAVLPPVQGRHCRVPASRQDGKLQAAEHCDGSAVPRLT